MPTRRKAPAPARPAALLTSTLSDLANRQPFGGSLPYAVGIDEAGVSVDGFGTPYLGPTQAPWGSPQAAIDDAASPSPPLDPAVPALKPGPKRAVAHQRKRERRPGR